MSSASRPRPRPLVAACALLGAMLTAVSGIGVTVHADSTPLPEPGICQGCKPPLSYHGGPVLATAGLTVTPIYWAPDGYSFPTTYTTIVNQYITDVAAASGQLNNAVAVANEYYQVNGSTKTGITYGITAGAPVTATDAFPATASPCTIVAPYTACVTRDQLRAELVAVLAGNSLPADANHLYVLLFPPNVQTEENNARSQDVYCGIHGVFQPSSGATVLYADEPYITTCSAGQAPNGDAAADTEVSVLSHELVESMTDPGGAAGSPAWYDAAGNEIGDECNFNYGPPMGSTDPANPQTTQYNQVINGHNYYVQTEFSNAAYSANGIGKGCVTAAPAGATAAAMTTADGAALDTATVDASETKLAADGSSTSTVTVTVLDGAGDPVTGDHVHFQVTPSETTPLACGTLKPAAGVTDDNGKVVTTYTASTENAACLVVATAAESGSSDSATIYQGTSDSFEPTITDATLPTSITPGAPAQTFTVTAANPSSNDIADARFDVFITGDGNATTGLTSNQVHLAYSDDATGNTFVAVPVTGETRKGGEIAAYVEPDTAADLPAGGSRTITFRLSVDAGAPTSAATGSPMHLEADLDQFNPADGSQDNLDYVGPADVAIGVSAAAGGLGLWVIIVIVVVAVAVLAGGGVMVQRRRSHRPAG